MFFLDFYLKKHGFLVNLFLCSSIQIHIKIHAFLGLHAVSFFKECAKDNFVKTLILPGKN